MVAFSFLIILLFLNIKYSNISAIPMNFNVRIAHFQHAGLRCDVPVFKISSYETLMAIAHSLLSISTYFH